MGVVAALALVASVVGAFVASDSASDVDLAAVQARTNADEQAGAEHPAEWDPRVEHLVPFVEEQRGLEFKHPVQIDFLTPEAFDDEIEGSYEELTGEELEDLQDALPKMRALGLMEGEFDLLDAVTQLSQAGVAAFYHVEDKRIVAPTTDPTVADDVVLVHELTHALQDQHFDLDRLLPEDQDEGSDEPNGELEPSQAALDALIEGDAMRVETAYLETLSASDQEAYDAAQLGEVGDVQATIEQLPAALIAMFQAPYALGPGFVNMIAAQGGNEAVDRAFQDPPTSTLELVDPRRYLDGERIEGLDPPTAPPEADVPLDDGEFGALDAYLVLAERIDPLEALTALDHWGSDSYVLYEENDRVCFEIAVDSSTADGMDQLRTAFQSWVQQVSPAASAEVLDEAGGGLLIRTCDPGPEAQVPNDRTVDALVFVGGRSEVASTLMTQGSLGTEEAWDIADCYMRDVYELGFLEQEVEPDEEQFADILRACAG